MYTRLPKRVQAIANQTITASGNSGTFNNPSTAQNPMMEAIFSVTGAVSGTTPSLTVSVYEVDPITGNNVLLGSFTAVTATNNEQRLAFQPVFANQLYVAWVVSGTTPSFAGVECDLYFTPDGNDL